MYTKGSAKGKWNDWTCTRQSDSSAKNAPVVLCQKRLSTSISLLHCQTTKKLCNVLTDFSLIPLMSHGKINMGIVNENLLSIVGCLMSLAHCMYSTSPLRPRNSGNLLNFLFAVSLFRVVICHANMLAC